MYNQLQILGTSTSLSHIPPSRMQTRSGRVVSSFYFNTLSQRAKKLERFSKYVTVIMKTCETVA